MPSLDPEMRPILERLRVAPAVDYREMPISAARQLFEDASRPWNEGGPSVPSTELRIPTSSGETRGHDIRNHEMRARLYRPSVPEPVPLILFVHGGGWTFGSIDTHDGNMRRLSLIAGCAVLGIDYRLAPEHPFPTPLDDVMAALAFAESGGLGDGIDASRLAVAGDSAGANLALAALLRRRDEGYPPMRGAALFYGCYLPDFATASHRRLGDGAWMLTTEMMRWYWRNFLGKAVFDTKSLAAPYHAELSGVPPLYLAAAGLDPLLDDTVMLAEKLARAEVPYRLDHVPGVVHGYLRMAGELSAGRRTIAAAGEFLRDRL